jgi:hypothetical protein
MLYESMEDGLPLLCLGEMEGREGRSKRWMTNSVLNDGGPCLLYDGIA